MEEQRVEPLKLRLRRRGSSQSGPFLVSGLVLLLCLIATHALAFGLDLLSDHIGTIWLVLILAWAGSVSSWLARESRVLTLSVTALGALGVLVGVSHLDTGFVAGMMMIGALVLAVLLAASVPFTGAGLRPLAVPIAMFAAGALSVLIGGYRQAQAPAVPAEGDRPEMQLAYMQAIDQADRRAGLIFLDSGRDAARLRRVEALDAAGALRGPTAKWRAALIYQHGSCPRHFRRAHELASAAALHGVTGAASLARAAEDRWRLSTGRTQLYRTQIYQTRSDDCDVV